MFRFPREEVAGSTASATVGWSREAVCEVLAKTAIGRETLTTLRTAEDLSVWKVDHIWSWRQRKVRAEDPWPTEADGSLKWELVQDYGWKYHFRGKTIVLVVANQDPLTAAMTFVHEATHIRQDLEGKYVQLAEDEQRLRREVEASANEVRLLLELGQTGRDEDRHLRDSALRWYRERIALVEGVETIDVATIEASIRQGRLNQDPSGKPCEVRRGLLRGVVDPNEPNYPYVDSPQEWPFDLQQEGELVVHYGLYALITGW